MLVNPETRASLEQRLNEQPVLTPVSVGVLNQSALLVTREALDDTSASFHSLDA
jgi:hypothetical protein